MRWRRAVASILLLAAGCSGGSNVGGPAAKSLREIAAERDLRLGGYYQYEIRSESYDRVFAAEYAVLTVYLGWDWTHSVSRDACEFAETDWMVSFGESRGLEVHGHPLVWFEYIPAWVLTRPLAEAETIMNEHIDAVVGRYRGRVKLWDVVNEPLDDDGVPRRGHRWEQAMGSDYIRRAFVRARATDPGAVLRLNEYDIEQPGPKFAGMKALLQNLLSQGAPVQALGWQMHLKPLDFDAGLVLARMKEIADMGLDNYITELDVELPENPSAEDFENQRETYRRVVRAFLTAPRRGTLVLWGLRDGDPTWLTRNHPLPFDENLRKKPAYFGIQDALLQR